MTVALTCSAPSPANQISNAINMIGGGRAAFAFTPRLRLRRVSANAVNLWRRAATKLRSPRRRASADVRSREWSIQMRKMMTFTFGVLIGPSVATAYANSSKYPAVDSPNATKGAAMIPFEMMWNARGLPVEQHDTF
jgi:hypothetical protein